MDKMAHIQLDNSIECSKAIIVGDPKRVDTIKDFLQNPISLAYNREFKSIKGQYNGTNILVISTGIGAPSTCIAVEEMSKIGIQEIIRVGSCGAMQKDVKLGDLVIATAAVRDDGLTNNYVPQNFPALPNFDFLVKAKTLSPNAHFGLIRSHDCFYMDDNSAVESFWSSLNVIGADMESGALFVLGNVRKLKTLSILNNVVLYEGDLQDGVNSLVNADDLVAQGEKNSITLALDILTK